MLRPLITAVLSALSIAGPALAAPMPRDHYELLKSMKENGVTVLINQPAVVCFSDQAYYSGAYNVINGKPFLVLCQDARRNSDIEEDWSANDLDTIRHEVTHAIQDCIDGKTDKKFDMIFDYNELVDRFGHGNATKTWHRYIDLYGPKRVDEIKYEVEAIYVAETKSVEDITQLYKTFCSL